VVRDQIRDKLPYPFEDMGEQSVKNIARPVRAYAMNATAVASTPLVAVKAQPDSARRKMIGGRGVVAASLIAVLVIGFGAWWAWPTASLSPISVQVPASPRSPSPAASTAAKPAPRLSIVVLPFTNLSNDPEQEYFVDAVTDDLTTDLSRIVNSFVIARTTAFTYKGKSVDVKQIGSDLGVRYALEGSVRRAGEQVQVNVQLVDAESGAHLWADRFDTDRTNLAKGQSEITARLARTLQLKLVDAVGRRIDQDKPVNLDARDLVMRGWASFYRPESATNFQAAQRAFEQALEMDPESVDARVGIATILDAQLANGSSKSREQDTARSDQLLLETLERDRNDPRALAELGRLRRIQNRLVESQIELEKAIALDPNNGLAIIQSGITLLHLGQPEAALPHFEKSLQLNPQNQNIFYTYFWLSYNHLILDNTSAAIDFARKTSAANPRFPWGYLVLAAALGLRDDIDQARAALAAAVKLRPEFNSFVQLRAIPNYKAADNPRAVALREKTLEAGLRRAGMPDE
jgi:TolB-like protein/tetratricopeptide (TPR) repeat protein